jgi:hypothetical protein
VYWFVRNLIRTGNPVPTLSLGVGSLRLPTPNLPFVGPNDHRVLEYLADSRIIRSVFIPGLRIAFGPGALMLGILAVAFVIGVWRKGDARTLGLVAAAGLLAYLVTPLTAFGPKGQPSPEQFTLNLRYAVPALTFVALSGALRLGSLSGVLRRRAMQAGVAIVSATTIIMLTAKERLPLWEIDGARRLLLVGLVAVFAWLCAVVAQRVTRRTWVTLAVAAAVAVIVGGPSFTTRYLERRYGSGSAVDTVVASAGERLVDQRIGISGLQLAYPLYGPSLTNDVVYVGQRLPHGGQVDFASCAEWRAAVNESHVGYVIVAIPESGPTGLPLLTTPWAAAPTSVLVAEEPTHLLFRVDGPLSPASCPA